MNTCTDRDCGVTDRDPKKLNIKFHYSTPDCYEKSVRDRLLKTLTGLWNRGSRGEGRGSKSLVHLYLG